MKGDFGMFQFNRRKLLEVLGKGTAAFGAGLTFLGSGCAKKEETAAPAQQTMTIDERWARAKKISQGRKYIVALSCGSDNGNCEMFLSAAAMGAAELGVETELIKASTLNVNVLEGNPDDDVPWIHEKTMMEDCGLIVAVPCYSTRANGLFYAIDERILGVCGKYPEVERKTRVGAVIGVGGSGYDGWTSLVKPSVQIFMQHSRKIVDQMQVNYCGIREWNLWMQQGQPLTSHTHLARCADEPWDKVYTMWGEQPDGLTFFKMAVERAKQMGRNVAQAMSMPIEQVKYLGEQSGVDCPVCHSNVLLVPENLPYVGCPVCWIRGTLVVDKGQMKIEWNMKDAEMPRFCPEIEAHHHEYTSKIHRARTSVNNKEIEALKNEIFSQRKLKVVTPYEA